jgi:hypothetical protein
MPIRQYFLWVGSTLFAALLVANWVLPEPAALPHSQIPPHERVNLQIRSNHKWPERVVFDTTHSTTPLNTAVAPQPNGIPNQDLAQAEPRSALDAFAAMNEARTTSIATGDKVSAIQAKQRPLASYIAKAANAD